MPRQHQYVTSLVSMFGKALAALLLQYYLVNHLSVSDFAIWSKTLSLLVIISVSDLGVGQYVMTEVVDKNLDREGFDELISNATMVLVILASIAGVTLYVILKETHLPNPALLALIAASRLLFIPYNAVLSARSQFHERKLIEFGCYLVGLCGVAMIGGHAPRLDTTLLVFNSALTASGVVALIRTGIRTKQVCSFERIHIHRCTSIVQRSLPYFTNNLSGLLFYGGFVWIMSLILETEEVARLSILHALLFMNAFQIAEVVLRTRQVELRSRAFFHKIEKRFFVASIILGVLVISLGPFALSIYAQNYSFSRLSLLIYIVFAFGEIYWLVLHSRMQIVSNLAKLLLTSSLWKALSFVLILVLCRTLLTTPGLIWPLGLMAITSLGVLCFYRRSVLRTAI